MLDDAHAGPSNKGRDPARAFWWGLAFWATVCLIAIAVRGVRWEEGYERAQVLLGLTPYPEGHPHHRWVWNGFSLHYYITGAALWLTNSAALICGGRQFLATLAIHLPVFALVWLLARRAFPAHLAMLLSIAGANRFFQSYMPIEPWANKATSGLIGMGWAFAVLVFLAGGRWRTAGLLFGLMPLVHLGQWPIILLVTLAAAGWLWYRGDRAACRSLGRWAAAGLLCCALFALAQRAVLVPDPVAGAYHAENDGHEVWAAYTTHEDMHRALTSWPRFGPMGQSIVALAGALVLMLPLAWCEARGAGRRWPVLVPFTYALLSTAAIGFAQTVHGITGTDVPYIVVSWMPYRLTIHVSMLLLCAVCVWGSLDSRGRVSWGALAAAGWLAALPLWPHVLSKGLAERYFSGPETALFLLAGASLYGLWRQIADAPRMRVAWAMLAGAGLLALVLYHQFAGAATLAGLALALAGEHLHDTPRQARIAVGVTTVLGATALTSIFLGEWRDREHLPVRPFETEMANYLAAHSKPGDMVLTPLDEHYQMVLNRPVVATFETRQFMSYMKSLAATTDKLFADLYGVKDGHWYDWNLWMRRSEAEWQALGAAYGFRYVLSKDFHPLHLPARLAGDGLVLYEIPKAAP